MRNLLFRPKTKITHLFANKKPILFGPTKAHLFGFHQNRMLVCYDGFLFINVHDLSSSENKTQLNNLKSKSVDIHHTVVSAFDLFNKDVTLLIVCSNIH